MKKIIHNLRNQPEKTRRHLLHIITGVVALILIILWGYSLSRTLGSPETAEKIKQDLKPFSVLKDNLSNSPN